MESPFAALPREIVDQIITSLITLHAHDPAYQWTSLRHITKFHKSKLESHFLRFWLPKTVITVYGVSLISCDYRAWGVNVKSGGDIAHFKAVPASYEMMLYEGYVPGEWGRVVQRGDGTEGLSSRFMIKPIPNVHVKFGNGELSRGFAAGGLISDVQVPGWQTDEEGRSVKFKWKALFGRLFGEEMAMRRVGEILLKSHIAHLKATKAWPNTLPARHTAIIDFLRTSVQLRRRAIIRAARDLSPQAFESFLASSPSPSNPPHFQDRWNRSLHNAWFDPEPRITDNTLGGDSPDLLHNLLEEESMVFTMKNWRNWDVEEVARLRAREAAWECRYDGREFRLNQVIPWKERRKTWRKEAEAAGVVFEERLEKMLREWRRLGWRGRLLGGWECPGA